MKILYTILFAIFACSLAAQNQNKDLENTEEVIKFWNAKKELYIDNLLKKKIPAVLNDAYYNKIELTDFTKEYVQNYDESGMTHRLYLYTNQANSGFCYVNKEISEFLASLPNRTAIVYILDGKKVETETDAKHLISLKESDIKNIKYRRSDSDEELIVTIITN